MRARSATSASIGSKRSARRGDGPGATVAPGPLPRVLRNKDSLDAEECVVGGCDLAVRASVVDRHLADLDDPSLVVLDRARHDRVRGCVYGAGTTDVGQRRVRALADHREGYVH